HDPAAGLSGSRPGCARRQARPRPLRDEDGLARRGDGRARGASRAQGRAHRSPALALAERGAALGVRWVDQVAVSLDIAVFAADDEEDSVVVERVRDLARRGRLAVEEPAWPELARLALDLDDDLAAVHEVELVLAIVVMHEAFVVRRVDDGVDAEG